MLHRILPIAAVALAAIAAPASAELRFEVTYDAAVAESYTGRVYVMFSTTGRPPRMGPGWFGSDPFVSVEVEDWAPGTPLVVDAANADTYPTDFASIPEAEYRVQAVLRLNRDSASIGSAPGSAFSPEHAGRFGGASDEAIPLHVDASVPARALPPHPRIRVVEVESALLSAFHGRPVTMRAAVLLPAGYDDDENVERRYPTCYVIGGFGSDHLLAFGLSRMLAQSPADAELVRVFPDPQCFGGHHVFADSANNGPRGRAFVEELIPALERDFRLVDAPHGRFTTGVSSGGWSSLWLQVDHPDFFGGTWAIAPDPVDFRAFQLVDIYADGANMYRDDQGQRVAVAQRGGEPFAWMDDFIAMENVYGEGGQIRSFEWVFSPQSADGLPAPMFDRATGAVDPDVARQWEAFDIRLVLERRWAELGPRLAGKLNVFVGDRDTFYLHHAVALLEQSLEALGSDAVVEIHPGKDHGSIFDMELLSRIEAEMVEKSDRASGE